MESTQNMEIEKTSRNTNSHFSVKKCQHGHFHIHFRGITLTLTPTEFEQLAKTITASYLRYGVEEAISNQATH